VQGAKLIQTDIDDEKNTSKLLVNYNWDAVVNWIAYKPADIERDIRLFKNKTKQYIFISSVSAYQKPPSCPIVTEETPLTNPFWQYSRDKIDCENLLHNEYLENKFPITIVRPGLTYDTMLPVPFGDYTVVDRILNGKKIVVHGDGTSIWSFTHSEDFAKGFTGLLGRTDTIGESFHITTDELICWNQAYKFIGDAIGAKPKLVHVPSDSIIKYRPDLEGILRGEWSNSLIFDNTKIKTYVPEYKATIKFRDGIKRTLKWFLSDPKRMLIDEEDNKTMDYLINKFAE
jgi:nucleoside-diphosphate-sugar epimerase